MLLRFAILTACVTVLAGCMPVSDILTVSDVQPVSAASLGDMQKIESVQLPMLRHDVGTLRSWWSLWGDDTLNQLISSAMQLNMVALKEDDTGGDPKAALAAHVARNYITYRYVQNQNNMLSLYIQGRKDIYAVLNQYEEIDDSRLKAIKSEIEALEARSRDFDADEKKMIGEMTRLTKLLPEYVEQVMGGVKPLVDVDITPLLASPATLMARANALIPARMALLQSGAPQSVVLKSEKIFTSKVIGQFFGVSDEVYARSDSNWIVSVGAGVSHLDFSVLDQPSGNMYDVESFKNATSEFVMDIEHKLVMFSHMHKQYLALNMQASKYIKNFEALNGAWQKNAGSDLTKIQAQDEANKAELAALKAQYEMARILIDLYAALDVY